MDTALNFIAENTYGFYVLVGIVGLYTVLISGKTFIKYIVSKTETKKDDTIVDKVYEVLEKDSVKEVIEKVKTKTKKNK